MKVTQKYQPIHHAPPVTTYGRPMSPTTACATCGNVPAPDRPAVLWSMSVQAGDRRYVCGPCARADLARIESGVDGSRSATPVLALV
jgi:hypothetical protein